MAAAMSAVSKGRRVTPGPSSKASVASAHASKSLGSLQSLGSKGSVSHDRLDPDTELASWFCVGLPREELKQMVTQMLKHGMPGDFIVRDVSSDPGAYGLSVRGPAGDMLSFLIVRNSSIKNPGYLIKGTSKIFPTVSSLIQFYAAKKQDALGIKLILREEEDDDDDGPGGANNNADGDDDDDEEDRDDADRYTGMPGKRLPHAHVITPPPVFTGTGLTDEQRWAMNKKLELAAGSSMSGSARPGPKQKRQMANGEPLSDDSDDPDHADEGSHPAPRAAVSAPRDERERKEEKRRRKEEKRKEKKRAEKEERRRRKQEQLQQLSGVGGYFPNFASLSAEAQIEAAAMQVELLRREADLAQARLAAVQATAMALRSQAAAPASAGKATMRRRPTHEGSDGDDEDEQNGHANGNRTMRRPPGGRGARGEDFDEVVMLPPSGASRGARRSSTPELQADQPAKPAWKVQMEQRKRERELREQMTARDFEAEQAGRARRVDEQLRQEQSRGMVPAHSVMSLAESVGNIAAKPTASTSKPASASSSGGAAPAKSSSVVMAATAEGVYDNGPPLNNRNSTGDFRSSSDALDQDMALYERRKKELMDETQKLMDEHLAEMDPELRALINDTQRMASEAMSEPAKPAPMVVSEPMYAEPADLAAPPAHRAPGGIVVSPDSPSTPRHEPPPMSKQPVRSAMKKRPSTAPSPQFDTSLNLRVDPRQREEEVKRLKVLQQEENRRRTQFDEEINQRFKRCKVLPPVEMQRELRVMAVLERDELQRRQEWSTKQRELEARLMLNQADTSNHLIEYLQEEQEKEKQRFEQRFVMEQEAVQTVGQGHVGNMAAMLESKYSSPDRSAGSKNPHVMTWKLKKKST